jgi:hypothetical protein
MKGKQFGKMGLLLGTKDFLKRHTHGDNLIPSIKSVLDKLQNHQDEGSKDRSPRWSGASQMRGSKMGEPKAKHPHS